MINHAATHLAALSFPRISTIIKHAMKRKDASFFIACFLFRIPWKTLAIKISIKEGGVLHFTKK